MMSGLRGRDDSVSKWCNDDDTLILCATFKNWSNFSSNASPNFSSNAFRNFSWNASRNFSSNASRNVSWILQLRPSFHLILVSSPTLVVSFPSMHLPWFDSHHFLLWKCVASVMHEASRMHWPFVPMLVSNQTTQSLSRSKRRRALKHVRWTTPMLTSLQHKLYLILKTCIQISSFHVPVNISIIPFIRCFMVSFWKSLERDSRR